jgi:hypothetical protein
LKWYENTQGRIATRKLFKALKDTIEDNPELYKSMISFEKHQSPKNNSFINNLYVEMCFKYSRYDIGQYYLTFVTYLYIYKDIKKIICNYRTMDGCYCI